MNKIKLTSKLGSVTRWLSRPGHKEETVEIPNNYCVAETDRFSICGSFPFPPHAVKEPEKYTVKSSKKTCVTYISNLAF